MARLGAQTMTTSTVAFRREAALGLPTTGGWRPASTPRRAAPTAAGRPARAPPGSRARTCSAASPLT